MVPGTAMTSAQIQIRDTELREDGAPAGMRYDAETNSVMMGEGKLIPWSEVRYAEQIDVQAKCEMCGKTFRSNSALNGHTRHCQEAFMGTSQAAKIEGALTAVDAAKLLNRREDEMRRRK